MKLALTILTAYAMAARANEHALRCKVDAIPPTLLYTAPEIAAGFTYSLPPARGWSVTADFTSSDGRQSRLSWHIDGTDAGKEDVRGSLDYWLGFGTYLVRTAIADESGGVCRQEWSVDVGSWPAAPFGLFPAVVSPTVDYRTRFLVADNHYRLGTPPGTVRAPSRAATSARQAPAGRIAILIDMPAEPSGQVATLDALEALVTRLPAPSLRLAIFSTAEGHDLLHLDDFSLSAMQQARSALAALLGYRAVTVAELQAHPLMDAASLLNFVIDREMHEGRRANSLIFLGTGSGGASVFHFTATPPGPLPAVSYIELMRPRELLSPGGGPLMRGFSPSVLAWAVKKFNGRTMMINVDKDFSQAVEKVRKSMPPVRQ